MSISDRAYPSPRWQIAADADVDERSSFITKTYIHLLGAIGAFVLIEYLLLNSPIAQPLIQTVLSVRYSWLIVMGLFMVVSWIANSWATSATSPGLQYAGLGLFIVAESFIFVPLLYMAREMGKNIIPTAGAATLGLFCVLTAVVLVTRKDFSWMRSILFFVGIAAMGLIACSIFFNFQLGQIFTVAMIVFACCYILYDTSNVLHHYHIGQHVAASLALFASVALLFWYIVQLFMSRD